MQQQEHTLSKDSTIKQALLNKTQDVHPEESTTKLLDWYYFVLFQDCENMVFME